MAAVGLLPLARGGPAISLWRRLCFAILVTARSDFLERAPVEDPYIQVALPPIPHPDKTMVLMTGDAPMGFIAPPCRTRSRFSDRRLDGAAQDGTRLTKQMRARVAAAAAERRRRST